MCTQACFCHKLQSFCPLSSCHNYCLYAVTVGVADGGVADAVDILHLSINFFFLRICISSWGDCVWLTQNPRTNYIFGCFFLPVSVSHSLPPPPPPPFFFHCALKSGIVHKFVPKELIIGLQCLPTHRHRVTWGLCTRGRGGGGIGVLWWRPV